MKLSKNFYLSEFTKSSTADRRGIDNTIPADRQDIIDNLRAVALYIVQPVRDHFGVAFSPSSGYRCLELNRAIGSEDNSQHILGEAVDMEIPGVTNLELMYWIKDNLLFDQLILEHYNPKIPNSGWCHCSYKLAKNGINRNQAIALG